MILNANFICLCATIAHALFASILILLNHVLMKTFLWWILFIEHLNQFFHLQETIWDHSRFILIRSNMLIRWTEYFRQYILCLIQGSSLILSLVKTIFSCLYLTNLELVIFYIRFKWHDIFTLNLSLIVFMVIKYSIDIGLK